MIIFDKGMLAVGVGGLLLYGIAGIIGLIFSLDWLSLAITVVSFSGAFLIIYLVSKYPKYFV